MDFGSNLWFKLLDLLVLVMWPLASSWISLRCCPHSSNGEDDRSLTRLLFIIKIRKYCAYEGLSINPVIVNPLFSLLGKVAQQKYRTHIEKGRRHNCIVEWIIYWPTSSYIEYQIQKLNIIGDPKPHPWQTSSQAQSLLSLKDNHYFDFHGNFILLLRV